MDTTGLLNSIMQCDSMIQLDNGELVVFQIVKGKHIMAASKVMQAHPEADYVALLIGLTITIDGNCPTMEELMEMPANSFLAIMTEFTRLNNFPA